MVGTLCPTYYTLPNGGSKGQQDQNYIILRLLPEGFQHTAVQIEC